MNGLDLLGAQQLHRFEGFAPPRERQLADTPGGAPLATLVALGVTDGLYKAWRLRRWHMTAAAGRAPPGSGQGQGVTMDQ